MKNFSVIILAAGVGSRMKSSLPKVMHKLSGKPLVRWVIDAACALKPNNIVVVLGYKSKNVEECLLGSNVKFVYQKEQLGSAHAVMQTEEVLKNYSGNILVISGDVPLIKPQTLLSLIKNNEQTGSAVTVLSCKVENPFGYGRIIRKDGLLEKIIEEKDSNLVEKLVKEINSGIYCFDKNLWQALLKVKQNNKKKEYYLTDTIAILKESGKKVSSVTIKDEYEVKGINNRVELSKAQAILKDNKIKELLDKGVSFIDTTNVYVSYDAKIGRDTVIYPGVFIDKNVVIGKKCVIKGASYITDSKIGDESSISYSYVEGAIVGKKVKIGPFSHIRQESVLGENVKIGNFSEIKKAVIAKNSKVNHLSYIGDADVGKDVNIGAGTVTCNYNGEKKHRTIICQKSFIGSNVNFVAPVKIGSGAQVAAGSTITSDVPPGKLAIARARQELKHRKNHK
jgi:bifunctional UDP-N-acetylglucosamine pyrophosphorylase/glucosamine-1-phosphate N-acetyltransferase